MSLMVGPPQEWCVWFMTNSNLAKDITTYMAVWNVTISQQWSCISLIIYIYVQAPLMKQKQKIKRKEKRVSVFNDLLDSTGKTTSKIVHKTINIILNHLWKWRQKVVGMRKKKVYINKKLTYSIIKPHERN